MTSNEITTLLGGSNIPEELLRVLSIGSPTSSSSPCFLYHNLGHLSLDAAMENSDSLEAVAGNGFYSHQTVVGNGFHRHQCSGNVDHNNDNSCNDNNHVVDLYPLNTYFFESKSAVSCRNETQTHRFSRLKSNYEARGMRTCVGAVLLVELHKHPHLLLLQLRNSIYMLPGGRVRSGESEVDGLRRKLTRKLSVDGDIGRDDWEVSEFLGTWWRRDFETFLVPYLPPNTSRPKECKKIYLVKLPCARVFSVPRNMRLLAVPLCQVHENQKTYGDVIAGIPHLLSKFSFNMIEVD